VRTAVPLVLTAIVSAPAVRDGLATWPATRWIVDAHWGLSGALGAAVLRRLVAPTSVGLTMRDWVQAAALWWIALGLLFALLTSARRERPWWPPRSDHRPDRS
jgi:hypothetical protein